MARILLADDNAALLAALGQLLRDTGHEVTSTNSVADTICLLSAKPPPDLLVLDMVFPGTADGRTVLGTLGPSAPPVILMSGTPVDEELLGGGHVKRVLSKVFTPEQFREAVDGVLNQAGGANKAEGHSCSDRTYGSCSDER